MTQKKKKKIPKRWTLTKTYNLASDTRNNVKSTKKCIFTIRLSTWGKKEKEKSHNTSSMEIG